MLFEQGVCGRLRDFPSSLDGELDEHAQVAVATPGDLLTGEVGIEQLGAPFGQEAGEDVPAGLKVGDEDVLGVKALRLHKTDSEETELLDRKSVV